VKPRKSKEFKVTAKQLVINLAVHGALVAGIMLTAAVAPGNVNRDKTGTNAERLKHQGSQVASSMQLASLGSFEAERGGFEPPVPISQTRHFQCGGSRLRDTWPM
jgi:hypothetical protein